MHKASPTNSLLRPKKKKVEIILKNQNSQKNLKRIIPLTLSVLILGLAACTTTAPPELYAPAGSIQPPYSIGGELDPFSRGSAVVTITINEEVVIQTKVPAFRKRTEAAGTFEGKRVNVSLTKIRKFTSSYVRADVTIDGETAASLIL